MALVEDPGLVRRGLGSQSHHHFQAQRIGPLPQQGHKIGVSLSLFRKNKLKIHINTAISLFQRRTDGRVSQRRPAFSGGQNHSRPLIGKGAVLSQRGQMKPRRYAVLVCPPQECFVLQRYQSPSF